MATSPLVNLDLVNQIYRTINAQISERVYKPEWKSDETLGTSTSRYTEAYLNALDVSGMTVSSGGFKGSLVTVGAKDYISFKRYQTESSKTATDTQYEIDTSLDSSSTGIPTSKAVYAVIGNLEELLKNI